MPTWRRAAARPRSNWRAGSGSRSAISDIVYRLALHSAQLDVTMMQGRMQIDEFSAAYLWRGDTLLFGDPAKDARYEIRVGAKRAPARR